MFWFRADLGRVGVAFTDRHGGVSAAPYDSLNLGLASGDDPAAVEHNYARVATALAMGPEQMARMHQVHGNEVAVLRAAPAAADRPRVDAMATDQPGLALSVRVADCVPVLLGDAEAGVVGCAHAGRSGLAGQVVPQVVEQMRRLGATDIAAWVGPHVCGRCYEVPAQMRDEVAAVVPETRAQTSWGTPALDLGAGVRAQLRAAGCEPAALPVACTLESMDLYSHRRDGDRAGRFAGLVWLRP